MDHFGWYRSWWGVTVLKVRLGYHFCIIRSWRVPILKVRPQRHFCINNPASLVITHGIVHGSVQAMGTENGLSSPSSFALCHADSTSTFKTGLFKSSFLSQLIIVFIPTVHGRWMDGREGGGMHEWAPRSFVIVSCHLWLVRVWDWSKVVGGCMYDCESVPVIFLTAICGCCISETDLWSWNWWYGWGGGGGGGEGEAIEKCVSSALHKTGVAWCVTAGVARNWFDCGCLLFHLSTKKSDVLSIWGQG